MSYATAIVHYIFIRCKLHRTRLWKRSCSLSKYNNTYHCVHQCIIVALTTTNTNQSPGRGFSDVFNFFSFTSASDSSDLWTHDHAGSCDDSFFKFNGFRSRDLKRYARRPTTITTHYLSLFTRPRTRGVTRPTFPNRILLLAVNFHAVNELVFVVVVVVVAESVPKLICRVGEYDDDALDRVLATDWSSALVKLINHSPAHVCVCVYSGLFININARSTH